MDKTAGDPLPIPEYRSDLFVNREEEIELAEQKARALSMGNLVRERTIVFWGYKGTGRTWLLKCLGDRLPRIPGVRAQYLDLANWEGQTPEQAVAGIISRVATEVADWLGRQTAGSDVSEASLVERSEWLLSDIRDMLRQHALVLLLDHVYESDWALLDLLEERVLARLAVQPQVLLVMAGRGRAYPWKTPELRLYTEEQDLIPFDEGLTEQQLEKQKPDAVRRTPEIHKMSLGYPLGNYLLATRPTVAEAMKETVDALLDGVPAEERSWLEALCVLRAAFDEDHIPIVLAGYFDDSAIQGWAYRRIRETRDRLLRTGMVHWEEEAGGWVVDRAIRPVLDRYLQQSRPETWKRVHSTAYRLYRDWLREYLEEMRRLDVILEEMERLLVRAEYHAQRLSEMGVEPPGLSSSVPEERKERFQIFLAYVREDEQRVMNLYQKLYNTGFRPWIAKEDILPGETWETSIRKAIEDCDFFLVCLSANSINKRGFLQKEIENALDIRQEMLDRDIYLIPVRLEYCEVPAKLRDIQWVDLFKKDGWTRLITAIWEGWQRRQK